MKHTHCIILARNCNPVLLNNRQSALQLLDKLQPSIGLLDKKVVSRENGIVAYYVSDHEHLILTTNPALNEAFLDMRSRRTIDQNKLIEQFQQFTESHFTNISFREFTNNDYTNIECQETRCAQRATKEYNGMKLCHDHYEQWQEREAVEEDRTEYF